MPVIPGKIAPAPAHPPEIRRNLDAHQSGRLPRVRQWSMSQQPLNEDIVTVDVREDLRRGIEPFAKIMGATRRLGDRQTLRLIAPFEPVPLFGVMARMGFRHEAKPISAGDWEVLFQRSPATAPTAGRTPGVSQSPADSSTTTPVVEVDARGLEPPQPLVVILEALEELPAGAGLRALTDRRPLHLYDQLAARGFAGQSEEQNDGSFITHIHRA